MGGIGLINIHQYTKLVAKRNLTRANKKIRRSGKDNLENAYSCKSNDYRKENESWHIWDYRFFLGGENQYGERNLGGT